MADEPWTFTPDPLQPHVFRLMQNDRIVGMVATEADAKLICELVNAQVQRREPQPGD